MIDPTDVLSGLTPEMRAKVEGQSGILTKQMMEFLKRKTSGAMTYKSHTFATVADMTRFMNEHKDRIIVVSALPDFQTFAYHLVYEETI